MPKKKKDLVDYHKRWKGFMNLIVLELSLNLCGDVDRDGDKIENLGVLDIIENPIIVFVVQIGWGEVSASMLWQQGTIEGEIIITSFIDTT